MAILLSDLRTKVLSVLQKNSSYAGFYELPKVDDAINDCLDYISVHCFQSSGNFFTTMTYFTTVSGDVKVGPIPDNMAMIKELRYLVGNIYQPLMLDTAVEAPQYYTGGEGASTVDADSSSGQPVLNIADTKGFFVGEPAIVGAGTARQETLTALSVQAGVSITSTTNLTYTHTALQADTVRSNGSTMTQYPSRYRIIDNYFYFNPGIGVGATNALQVEYVAYPDKLVSSSDPLLGRFDRAMQNYVKYRAASILASSVGKQVREWERYENEWFQAMLTMVYKRLNVTSYNRNFEG